MVKMTCQLIYKALSSSGNIGKGYRIDRVALTVPGQLN